jgi:hypothetical protein
LTTSTDSSSKEEPFKETASVNKNDSDDLVFHNTKATQVKIMREHMRNENDTAKAWDSLWPKTKGDSLGFGSVDTGVAFTGRFATTTTFLCHNNTHRSQDVDRERLGGLGSIFGHNRRTRTRRSHYRFGNFQSVFWNERKKWWINRTETRVRQERESNSF